MNTKYGMATLAASAILSFALPLHAQLSPRGMSVFDNTGREVGRAFDVLNAFSTPPVFPSEVHFSTSFAGHTLTGTATGAEIHFDSVVLFPGLNCTGQAYLDPGVLGGVPQLFEPLGVASAPPNLQVFVASRTTPAGLVPTILSRSLQGQLCENLPAVLNNQLLVAATSVGSFAAFTAPFKIDPSPAAADTATLPVAAVTPGGLALLAGLLALIAIPFLARQRRI